MNKVERLLHDWAAARAAANAEAAMVEDLAEALRKISALRPPRVFGDHSCGTSPAVEMANIADAALALLTGGDDF